MRPVFDSRMMHSFFFSFPSLRDDYFFWEWELKAVTGRISFLVPDRVPPLPSSGVSDRPLDPGFLEVVAADDFPDAVDGPVAVPVVLPAAVGLLDGRHERESSADVFAFVLVGWVEEGWGVPGDLDEDHKGGFGGDGITGDEVAACLVGWLTEDFVEEGWTQRDEVVAVVVVVVAVASIAVNAGEQFHAVDRGSKRLPFVTVPGELLGNLGEDLRILLLEENPETAEFFNLPGRHGAEDHTPHLVEVEVAVPA